MPVNIVPLQRSAIVKLKVNSMSNSFYSVFDNHLLLEDEDRPAFHRSAFQQDRDRILYTAYFRRLQAKTQVFFSGEYDFYRTRLTHSLEVAQIGRSICQFLKSGEHLREDFYIDSDLVEAICLAHDIGHPPFGHAGESTMNSLMEGYGGFEGNAQTLRILTEIIYSGKMGREGMNPTRALVDGVMKYKKTYADSFVNNLPPKNHFLFDEQRTYINFIFDGAPSPPDLNNLNDFRSVECQIMDWADDTAYCINDLLDGINSGLITLPKIEAWAASQALSSQDSRLIERLLDASRARYLSRYFNRKIGDFIHASELITRDNFMATRTNRYKYGLKIDPGIRGEADLYGQISRELVFWSPQIFQLEFKADFIIRNVFKAFQIHYLDTEAGMALLPESSEAFVRGEKDKMRRARLICDYISGMTDGFAIRTYKRLYDPDFGSIMDLV